MSGWPVETIVETARRKLLHVGAVTAGFGGVSVESDDGCLIVQFQWRKGETTYAVRIPLPGTPPASQLTGEPVESPAEWAQDVAYWLMEELDTGLVRRAGRTCHDRYIELEPRFLPRIGHEPFCVSTVPLGPGAGQWLSSSGLRISSALAAMRERRLVAWLQAYENSPRGARLGHAVVSWQVTLDRIAQLDLIETTADAPDEVHFALAVNAVHEAADVGATDIVTSDTHPTISKLGFRPAPEPGIWRVTTREFLKHSWVQQGPT